MSSVYQIIEQLAATTKKKEKEAILKEHANDAILRECFRVAYHPMINFYIRQIPEPVDVGQVSVSIQSGIEQCLETLATRKLTGHDARDWLAALLGNMEDNDRIVLARVLKRDLRCGVTDTMASCVWPNLVPEYPMMLCVQDKPKNRERIKFPAFAQLKSDGKRVNAVIDANNDITYISRGGLEMEVGSPSMDHFFKDLAALYGEPMVFDGELLWLDDNGNIAPREIGNGKAKKADSDRNRFVFSIWDAIPLRVRDGAPTTETYRDRFGKLARELSQNSIKHGAFNRVHLILTREVQNWEEAEEFYAEVLEEGEEGLIIKNRDGLWENDRSKNCVKMKAEIENDFEIVGWNPGRGKYEGKIGSFKMATADGGVQFNCSGMPDSVRDMDPEALVGKIADVKYNMIMPSKNGLPRRAFLPRILEIRDDKTVADIL